MIVHYRTKGFFIKKVDRGEADQLFTIYTKDFGKLEVLGKAIRKIKSKLRGGAELFYLSEIEFIQGKAYKTLTDAILIENFLNIRKDLSRLTVAYKIVEVLDSLVIREEKDDQVWQLLKDIFVKLNSLEIKNCLPCSEKEILLQGKLEILYYYFFWNLASILGYQPELYNCSMCQKRLKPEKLYFNLKEGGVICQNCFKKNKSNKEIESEIVKVLRIILEKNWQTLSKLKINPLLQKSLKNISQCYLNYTLDEIK